MANKFIYFKRAFLSEMLKISKSLTSLTVIIAPVFITFISFMIFYNYPHLLTKNESNPWIAILLNSIQFWAILLYTMLITLITFLINNFDHQADGWKHLNALPIPRTYIYIAKLTSSLLLVTVSILFYYGLFYLEALLLWMIYPDIPFANYNTHIMIAIIIAKFYVSSLIIFAIQFVISLHYKNFIVPIGVGVLGATAVIALFQWKYLGYFPYAFPLIITRDITQYDLSFDKFQIWFSIGFGSLILISYGIWNKVKNIY